MAYPDNKSIEEAKAFLRTRLSAEQSMSRHLEEAMYIASVKIIRIAKKYGVSISNFSFSSNIRMKQEIDKVLQELAEELYEDMEILSVHANEDDKTYIIAYINQDFYGMDVKGRIDKWVGKFKDDMEGAIREDKTEVIKKMAAFFGLDRLLRHTIGRAYMNSWYRQHEDAIGFYAFRGSSYPCDLCDSYVGFHTMDDYRLPLHPKCCCYAVFIYI